MKVTLLHSIGNGISFPLPTELRTSTSLSSTFPTQLTRHKGVPSLLHSLSTTFPYQCRFLSNKNQVMVLCCSNRDMGVLCSKVTIQLLSKLSILFRKTSHIFFVAQSCMCEILSSSSLPFVCEFVTHLCVCWLYVLLCGFSLYASTHPMSLHRCVVSLPFHSSLHSFFIVGMLSLPSGLLTFEFVRTEMETLQGYESPYVFIEMVLLFG
jgi:hypothetical protein